MTDTSRDDDPVAPSAGDGGDGDDAVDPSGTTPPDTDGGDAADPLDTDQSTGDASGDSPAVAIAAALGLGVLGPLIALVGGIGVFALDVVFELSLVAQLVLTLFVGQYVAFAGLAVAYLAWRGLDRSGIVEYLGVRRPSLLELGIVVVGWVAILISVIGISVIIQLIGVETAANQSAEVALQNPAIVPLFILASFLVIGPCEELLYRGVVQGRLRESLPAAPSIVIASAIFALIHVMALTGGITGRLTTVAILFFPSLIFGVVYEYTGNIVVPSLLHGLHNAVIFTLLYVSVVYFDELEEMAEAGATLLPV
ncbi:CPBP family intramembrane metalloprotease [Halorubrum sp. JWXQ-INN 858]|uniref:CPBP family intramembrane glutamic endopeptidase n=1 Tax=Halorubrum sp. JWXQ-INN 858 TaxID=2690782 RepID=UPI00135983FE|nr:type II CAAX endopeptidase family protein [Halorubrum sp. JWXQ-INN 858]MWV63278.1 CPBP family intramembrane metalloprotease [Halorubrum sp. JWXQ-INN 858]